MSKLRSEGVSITHLPALPDDTALYLILESVARRRMLIYGKLKDGEGHYCAIGAFWEDNPEIVLRSSLIDEVAAVNDSVPESATPQERWKKVTGWLRWKVKVLARL